MLFFTILLSVLSPFIGFLMLVLNRVLNFDVNPEFVFFGTVIVLNSIAIQLSIYENKTGIFRKR